MDAGVQFTKVESEFYQHKRRERTYLVYTDLLKFTSLREWLVDFGHLPTLFAVNKGRDGRFTLNDLRQFWTLCNQLAGEFRGYELGAQIRAVCSLKLYNVLKLPESQGSEAVQTWALKVLLEGKGTTEFEDIPNVVFVDRNLIAELHQYLSIAETNGMDLQTFIDLMQSVGEDMAIMNLNEERLDDVVPQVVLQQFLRAYFAGFEHFLTQMELAMA